MPGLDELGLGAPVGLGAPISTTATSPTSSSTGPSATTATPVNQNEAPSRDINASHETSGSTTLVFTPVTSTKPAAAPAQPVAAPAAAPARPPAQRRQTPRPIIARTQSSFTAAPPSPPPKDGAFISSTTATQQPIPDGLTQPQLPKAYPSGTGNTPTPVRPAGAHSHPATNTSSAFNGDPAHPSFEEHKNTLPTAPTVHPAEQERQLRDADPEVVGREVEKHEGDLRQEKGEAPKGRIVEGIEDDKLFALMRRFDQDVVHCLFLTSIVPLPLDQPDLRRSVLPNNPFNSDTLKSNLERVYAGSGVSAIRTFNELLRLRAGWDKSALPSEKKRTSIYCATYFTAWVLGLAIPTLVAFMMVLIISPEARLIAFPPMPPVKGTPPSATDPLNKKGDTSLLGGTDSAVVHRSTAEQREEQAWEFRQLAEAFAVKLAVSKGRQNPHEGNAAVGVKDMPPEDISDVSSETSLSSDDLEFHDTLEVDSDLYAPGEHPKELIRQNKRSRGKYDGGEDGMADVPQGMKGRTEKIKRKDGRVEEKPVSDKRRKELEAKEAKAKRDAIVAKYVKMTQDGLGDFADLTEIITNALSPPPPFPPAINLARYKIAGAIFLPILLATAFIPAWIWARSASFALGFGFFGQPLIDRGIAFFVKKVPNWAELLDMRNSLLRGVPTNDQLVLHLLRVGEKAGKPLPRPPPPPLAGTPKEQIKDNAPDPDDNLVDEDGNPITVDDLSTKDKVMHKGRSKLVSGFKNITRKVAAMGADVTVDGTRKKVGGKVDRLIWGGMLKDDGDAESYPCKLNGKNGHIVLEPMTIYGVPRIMFNSASVTDKHEFARDLNDIVEIKKAGISVPRAVLGWASGADIESQTIWMRMKRQEEIMGNAVVGAKEVKGLNSTEGDVYEFKAVARRDQLFARILSLGTQRWESL